MVMDIYKLDLEWQYIMLAHHASELIKISEARGEILSEHIEPLKRRLEVIKRLREEGDEQGCEVFARGAVEDGELRCYSFGELDDDSIALNQWPSSQICMDCEHGAFIMGENIPASTYACKRNVQLGPCDSSCSMFEEKEFQEME
jgi:hypothetical protein